ncbi:MAG: urea ABC transporter permease subunit UrtB [Gammaproteobacteria bacterium]|nr:urea ABC transporter permease subunit UrtB [Gammaproteobacteria bacterium]MBT6243773.1 urea ABC transporter permease subunit UrtB [Gammaproteobacteria bacterium]
MLPMVLALGLLMSPPVSADDAFSAAVKSLNTRSFAEKSSAATLIAGMTHPRAGVVLEAMLTGNLYTKRRSDIVVIASALDQGGYRLVDAISGEALGDVGRRGAKKISVNNGLRKQLRGLIAGRQLNHADFQDRIEAVEAIVVSGDIQLRPLLVSRRQLEQEVAVLEALDNALVIFDLDVGNGAVRLAAIQASANNLHPTVRTKLTNIASDQSLDPEIRGAANQALLELEALANQYQIVETFFFGLSLGSILVLAAIGLSITFGVMGVINMAHGELIMIGAYITYVVQILFPDIIEYSLLIAVPAAFCVSGIVGIMIERSVIQFLYGRPLETLLATFGVSLILQQAVRSLFSPLNRAVLTPEWMSGSLEIAQGLSITYNRLYIFFFALLVFAALLLILQRTRLGLEVRAVTQNRSMAKAMGIRSARVDIMTFGLGAGIAGVAGVALSQLTNVGPNLGQGYIVDSFMVVVFGGVGNLWGTLVAGLSLGVVNKFIEPVAGAVVAKILVLIFIILFIQKRPRGLFPQKGRAVED